MTTTQVGYLELLRSHATFRRFFVANVISLLGTWFSTVALFVLAERISSSPELTVGIVLVLQMIALAVPQPFTGMLADRFSRKRLMVLSELLSAGCAVALLFVEGPEDAWLYYLSVALLMVFHAVYMPAESAALPNIVPEPEALVTANAMNSASWSVALALGAAAGGWLVAQSGTDAAFWVDAVTFIISAALLSRLDIPQGQAAPSGHILRGGVAMIVEGLSRIRRSPPVYRVLTAKALWAFSGGGLVYGLILLGEEMQLAEVATGVGLLFAVRGVGSGIGPVVARWVLVDRTRWALHLGLLVSLSGVGYLVVGLMPWSLWIIVPVLCSHAASGANWVLSTVMLQERTEDAWRGRVFATDFLLVTLVNGLSSLVAALWVTYGEVPLRTMLLVLAGLQAASGAVWLALTWPGERRAQQEARLKDSPR